MRHEYPEQSIPTTQQSPLKAVPSTSETVLITGGAGFLGSALCDHYINRGMRVICVDNLSTGRMQNIEHLMENDAFSFIKHDVSVPFDISEDIGFIFNMASPASPPKYQIDPIATFRTIVIGAENMLTLAHRKGARILEASTSEIYGDPEVSPQPETYRGSVNTMGPRSCYDEGKRAAETLFYDYNKNLGTDIRVARIFNTYGPRMDPEDGRVVSNFIVQALSGNDLTIYGDGSQTRSFCYVDDLIAGLVALMHTQGNHYSAVNLGNPGEYTVRALATMILEETQSASHITLKPLPVDDPRQRRPDIGLAWRLLHWEPKVPLREGLRLTIPYFALELEQNPAVAKVAV